MMGGMWGTGMWGADGMSGWMLIIAWGCNSSSSPSLPGRLPRLSSDTQGDDSSDPAVKELRAAYARGDLSDEEYERRRDRLETEP